MAIIRPMPEWVEACQSLSYLDAVYCSFSWGLILLSSSVGMILESIVSAPVPPPVITATNPGTLKSFATSSDAIVRFPLGQAFGLGRGKG